MTRTFKAFFAYPSHPRNVRDSISEAVSRLRQRSFPSEVTLWGESDIAGRFFADGVLEKIDAAQVLLADISHLNFNVTYEIGYAIGAGKRVMIFKNSAIKTVNQEIASLGIYDTLGYQEYDTSDSLANSIRRIEDTSPLPLPGQRNRSAPVFLNLPKHKSDQSTLIQSRIKKARLFFRSFDPNETPRLSAPDAIRQVGESVGVLLHLIPEQFDDALNHNLRTAFLAGLAEGLGRELLLIQYSETPVPLDYRDAVTHCHHRDDFNEAIAEFASRTVAALQEELPVPAESPRGFLEQLNLGASSAENELTVLDKYYLEIDAFRRASRKEVRLITGRKGSGKTAIFFRLRDTIRKDRANVVLDLKPDGYQLLKFRDQVLKLMEAGTLDHTIMAFWEYLLLLELCYKLLEKDHELHKRDHRLFEPYQRLVALYRSDEYVAEGDFSERMSNLLHSIREDFQAKYGDVEKLSLSTGEITHLIYKHDVGKLRSHVHEYLRFKGEVWLLFDNIDKGWPTQGLDPEDLVIIKTLIEATRKIERDLRRFDIEAHTVIFLRNDVYELLVNATSDRGKEVRANVDWAEPDLFREMLRRRMAYGSDEFGESEFMEIWRHICTPLIHGEESSQYLIERSLMRPRYLIDLLSHCRGYAVNLKHAQIQEGDVDSGLRAFSTDLLSDISLEIRDVLPEAENVLYAFIGAPRQFSRIDLERIFQEANVPGEKWPYIYETLLWFAFLGAVWPDGEAKYVYSYSYDMKLFKGAIRKLETEGVAFQVNPAFWSALGIS